MMGLNSGRNVIAAALAVAAVFMASPVAAVVVPRDISQQLQQRFDAFITADGYSEVGLSDFPGGGWHTSAGGPRFEDYPVAVYTGPPAQLPPYAELPPPSMSPRAYRAMQEALSGQPDLAGEYVVVSRDCGTGCFLVDIVNQRTGQALTAFFSDLGKPSPMMGWYRVPVRDPDTGELQSKALPLGAEGYVLGRGHYLIGMRANSRLLVTASSVAADYGAYPYQFLRQYYVLRDGHLRLVAQDEVPLLARFHSVSVFGERISNAAGAQLPGFGDYPVNSVYDGLLGTLKLDVNGDLRDRIIRQMQSTAPVFAGEYVILQQPCHTGAFCKMEFLINRRTGRALSAYFKASVPAGSERKQPIGEWVRTAFANSRLLVTQQVVAGTNGEPARYFNRYYVLRDGALHLIDTIELPSPWLNNAGM